MGIKVSEEEMERILSTPGVVCGPMLAIPKDLPEPDLSLTTDEPKKKPGRARGRHVKGEKNKVEQAYEDTVLRPQLGRGEILGYWFEAVTLQLGHRCSYTPDYMVLRADLTVEFHEVKAMWGGGRVGWQEDGRIKFKAAASRYELFGFVAQAGRKGKAGWEWTEERL